MEVVIKYAAGFIKVSISKPGIYSMGIDSSIGKSHLYHILRQITTKDILALTYTEDKKDILSALKKFKDSDIPVLYIDRFDLMIDSEIVDVLKSMVGKYIILDYKDDNYNPMLNASFIAFVRRKDGFTLHA